MSRPASKSNESADDSIYDAWPVDMDPSLKTFLLWSTKLQDDI